MTKSTISLVCAFASAIAFVGLSSARAATAGKPDSDSAIGRRIDNFTLADFRGKKHSLSDFADKQAIVVAFLGESNARCASNTRRGWQSCQGIRPKRRSIPGRSIPISRTP